MTRLLLLLLLSAPLEGAQAPAVVIVCATGGVSRSTEGAIASGANCVLHDRQTGTTAAALVVYDAQGAAQ